MSSRELFLFTQKRSLELFQIHFHCSVWSSSIFSSRALKANQRDVFSALQSGFGESPRDSPRDGLDGVGFLPARCLGLSQRDKHWASSETDVSDRSDLLLGSVLNAAIAGIIAFTSQ